MRTDAHVPTQRDQDSRSRSRDAEPDVGGPALTGGGVSGAILRLQRTIGNQAVGRLLGALAVSQAAQGSGSGGVRLHGVAHPPNAFAPAAEPRTIRSVSRASAVSPQPVDADHQGEHAEIWEEGVHVAVVPQAVDWTTLEKRLRNVTRKLGVTGDPQGSKAPGYELRSEQNTADGSTTVTIEKGPVAAKGTHDSYFLGPKERKTFVDPLGYVVGQVGEKGTRYLEITQAISNMAKAGEQEHCDDYEHAYNISLGALDNLIDEKIKGQTFTDNDEEMAKKRARKFVDDMMKARGLGWMGWKQSGWLGEYTELSEKTRRRDSEGWHDFTDTQERAGDDVIVHISARGTQIGTHPSAEIITPRVVSPSPSLRSGGQGPPSPAFQPRPPTHLSSSVTPSLPSIPPFPSAFGPGSFGSPSPVSRPFPGFQAPASQMPHPSPSAAFPSPGFGGATERRPPREPRGQPMDWAPQSPQTPQVTPKQQLLLRIEEFRAQIGMLDQTFHRLGPADQATHRQEYDERRAILAQMMEDAEYDLDDYIQLVGDV